MAFTLQSTPSELFIRREGREGGDWFAFHVDGSENRVRFGRKGESCLAVAVRVVVCLRDTNRLSSSSPHVLGMDSFRMPRPCLKPDTPPPPTPFL